MSIDNRLLIIPAAPMLLWLFLRMFWAVTVGTGWHAPIMAVISLIIGLIFEVTGAVICYETNVDLGRTRVWPSDPEDSPND